MLHKVVSGCAVICKTSFRDLATVKTVIMVKMVKMVHLLKCCLIKIPMKQLMSAADMDPYTACSHLL